MKVILRQTVPNLGQAGDVKNVSDGFARNFLIPKGLILPVTETNLKKVEDLKKKRKLKKQKLEDNFQKVLAALAEVQLSILAKATPEGRLFAGVDRKAIARALREQKGILVPTDAIMLEKPIKEVGEQKVTIKLAEQTRLITLKIEPSHEK
ncbi:MAG: 50S ribosomal protein L9 [Patescibacteria group bacterium]|nr:50S ribosomal protein L9 [Patescibacteria group bacterium]